LSDTRVGRTPRSDAEWARETERRLRALERARTARAGEYVLSSRDGRLVATKPGETPLEVGQVPAPVEIDLSARGSVVSDITAIATAVGYPEVDEDDPPSLDDVRQWVLQQLFGKIPPSRIPGLPWAHLFDGAEELLDDPSFDNPSTFANNPAITYDPDFGRLKPGSARIDADGTTRVGVSNLISVAAGEVMPMSVHVFYEGVTATGQDPIRMSVRGYHVEKDGTRTLVDTQLIDAVAAPSGESDDVPEAEDGWLRLSGSYTVPELAESVDEIVMEISVTDAMTAGSVWFDDGSVKKTRDGMPQLWIKNLPTDLNSLWNGLTGMVDQLLIRLGITPVGGLFDRIFDLSDELEWIQEKAAEGAAEAAAALNNIGQLAYNLATNPASVLGPISQSMVTGLQSALSGVNNFVQSLIDAIVSALRRIPIVGGTLADIVADIGDLLDFVDETALEGQHTRESIVGGYRRSPAPGATTVDVENVMTDISTDIVVAQDSAITLANLANAPKNVPFWVSPDPFEDVAFPRAMLTPRQSINVGIGPTGSVWSGSAGSTAHTHSNPSPTVTTDYVIPAVAGADGDQYFNAIRTTYNRIYNTIGFITSGGTPPATVYAALYRIDPETGEATMEYDFGNVSAHILTGSGLVDQRLTMDHDIIANEGDLWAVSILPVGGSLGFGAIRRSDMGYTGIYPRYATARLTGRTFMPVSVAGDDFVSSNFRVWACLGQAHEEDTSPVTLVETFNAADTADWRSNNWNRWVSHYSYRLGIKGGRLYLDNGAAIAALTVAGSALHRTLLHTSDHACEITIGSGWDAAAYGHATTRAYVRCRSNGSGGVAMHLDNDGTQTRLRIATISTMTEVGTVRATVTGLNAAVGDRFRIQAEGSTYRCFRNDEPIPGAVWEDTAGIIPQTPAFRAVGCGVGNRRAILLGPISESAYIDHWRAYDL